MKILVLSTKPPWPPHDGGAVATSKCIEGLAKNGASVSVLAMRTQKHLSAPAVRPDDLFMINDYETVSVDTTIKTAALLQNLLFSKEPYDLARFRSDAFADALKKMVQREHYDIIQCEGLVFSLYLDLIRSLTDSTLVLRAHNLEHRIREMMAEQSVKRIEKLYLTNLSRRVRESEKKAAQHFDAIVPISNPDMEWFACHNNGKPILLAETGIDINIDPIMAPENTNCVGFIGALDWQPNIDGLLWFVKEVWPYVTKRIPSATLHVAGKNASGKLPDLIAGRNIIFKGEVTDSRAFTSSMNVMIAPLFAGSGIRVKIIEAMSLGRSVIATPVAAGGLPVTNNRDIIIAEDKFMFSTSLIKVLSQPDLRRAIEASAKKMVRENFDNSVLTGKMLSFYKELRNGC